MVGLLRKLIGTQNDRALRALRKVVRAVNSQAGLSDLDDAALQAKTLEFRQRLADGATLDDLLPEAFAVVREAAHRTLGLRHFDAQLIGGAVLHQGRIAEMRTGEGKTLVATLPAYLNGLTGEGVHIVTVNDYLARRDATWMGPVYRYLGLSVGVIQSFAGPGEPNSFLLSHSGNDLLPVSRREAYAADITYGTNNEFGFDYLRDNMALSLQDKSQRGQAYAIVDEVDSILIDEARTPLIISGQARDSSALYQRIDKLVQVLDPHSDANPGDFTLDEKTRQVELSEAGHEKIEGLLANAGLLAPEDSLYQAVNLGLLHHVHNALRARHLFHRDVEYIVRDGEVVLIDEHTGRTMPGRRLSEGLHQAIEAKEGVAIQSESQTLASTTFQNYFRLYHKLAGMTGTADTEAYEFQQIYGLQVVVIPPNKPVIRKDLNDLIFMTQAEKYNAVVDDIVSCRDQGAPVLVGTASIESSELLSAELKARGIEHQVLNAKFHEKEAHIIAQAGRPGTVTIATNMAGRGTDIVLGGSLQAELAALENPSEAEIARVKAAWEERHARVIAAGGLHILGTERHESRRIDNQLRGRAGRQGDPGLSRFYLAMEDNLMRLFITDRVKGMMGALGMDQGEAIEHRMVTNAVEKAQRKVEGRNFDVRKQLLEYDDVANDQRQVVYQQRDELLAADHITDIIENLHRDVVTELVDRFIPPASLAEQWNIPGLEEELHREMNLELPLAQWLDADDRLVEAGLRERIQAAADAAYAAKVAEIGPDIHVIEKQVMLQVLDNHWKEHLATMDQLRQGIGLRAYAQKNPKQEYKREAFAMFQELLSRVKHDTVRFLVRLQVRREEDINALEQRRREEEARQRLAFQHAEATAMGEVPDAAPADAGRAPRTPTPFVREDIKVGRNEPCPCGSGKKFKQCHGKL
ncbi:MAG: preprotein translocase subunit SecA [Gammaproteobacteria bacterium]|nr:preprotein translocase subunit SecA [Gammaproteobacteria bacterium]